MHVSLTLHLVTCCYFNCPERSAHSLINHSIVWGLGPKLRVLCFLDKSVTTELSPQLLEEAFSPQRLANTTDEALICCLVKCLD